MASIQKRGSSYRIFVNNGLDDFYRPIKKSMTFHPDPSWSEKRIQKELALAAAEFERQVKNGALFEGSKMSFAQFSDKWFQEYVVPNLAPNTQTKYADVLKNHILPKLGSQKLKNLGSYALQEFFNSYYDGQTPLRYSPGTIQKTLTVMKSIFKKAYQWRVVEENSMDRVYLPKGGRDPGNIKFFTVAQARQFLAFLPEPYEVVVPAHPSCASGGRVHQVAAYSKRQTLPLQLQVFFTLMLYGGFRKGEALALTWEDVDYPASTIRINKSVYNFHGALQVKEPKTKSSIRKVAMPPAVMEQLRQYQLAQQAEAQRLAGYWQEQGLLFTRDNGTMMGYSSPYQAFRGILERYNAAHRDDPLPMIPLHGLRHTAATIMMANHADPVTVAARLGHSQTSTTLNVYSHAIKSSDFSASALLEQALTPEAAPEA